MDPTLAWANVFVCEVDEDELEPQLSSLIVPSACSLYFRAYCACRRRPRIEDQEDPADHARDECIIDECSFLRFRGLSSWMQPLLQPAARGSISQENKCINVLAKWSSKAVAEIWAETAAGRLTEAQSLHSEQLKYLLQD